MGCVCVCVCSTTAEADASESIVYRYEGVGDQSAGRIKEGGVNRPTTCVCAARAFVQRVRPFSSLKGVYRPWENWRLPTGYSLYMG